MNDTRSSSMRRRPSSGSHAAMRTVGIPAVAGMSTPLSRPDTCASGAGMSTASPAPEPVHGHHERGLVAQAPVRVQRRLGHPGRPRGEQRHGDVGRPGRGRARPAMAGADARARPTGLRSPSPAGRARPGRSDAGMPAAARTSRGAPGRGRPPPRRHPSGGAAARPPPRAASTPDREGEAGAPLGNCQLTTSPRRTPVAASRPARAAMRGLHGGGVETPGAVDDRRPGSRRRPHREHRRRARSRRRAENDASSAPRSHAPPARR